MLHDLATMSLVALMLWAALAALIVWRARPGSPPPLPPKSPPGFMPPGTY